MKRSPASISRCRSKAGVKASRTSASARSWRAALPMPQSEPTFSQSRAGSELRPRRPELRQTLRTRSPASPEPSPRAASRPMKPLHPPVLRRGSNMLRMMLFASAAVLVTPAVAQNAVPADSAAISGLGIRNIGSATMSGRIAAVAGRQEKDGKITLIVGSASGGVWKSEDGGTTFKPVFDKQPVKSIGAVALDPTNPQVMWVGTGESWTRNSVSIGNGVYKSVDGGETWTNVGLPGTERITKIVVHPKNGNIVYVCAPGPLWSDSADRGLYKTTDGGRTWSLILKGANLSTGCSSITMDPANPEHLLAGTWDFRRKAYEFRSGGSGPDQPSGSRFAESHDGGRTWTYLDAANRKGLPKQPWGRLELAFAPSNPKRVYAFIENVRPALFVSEDGGTSWQERDRSQRMVW